jgi:hypothetical protein
MTSTAMQVFAVAVLVSWCHPAGADAQERFPRVHYLAGRPELLKPTEVTLVLDDGELRAEQTVYMNRGALVRTVFTIPLADIIAVGASLSKTDPLVMPGPSGVSSPLTQEEYVTLTLRSGDRIEAVLFKVERQQSAGIAAKVEAAADRAQEPPISQPTKARNVRPRRRPMRLVRIAARPAPPARDGVRKSRARRGSRRAADYRRIELT